jgi:hypothetical protein
MAMKYLEAFLAKLSTGPIGDTSKLESLLMDCWDDFSGSGEGKRSFRAVIDNQIKNHSRFRRDRTSSFSCQ